jgi:hypothetical protein
VILLQGSMIFFALAFIPLGFLAYTLINMNRLGIKITHPRVIVELLIFLGLVLAGVMVSC